MSFHITRRQTLGWIGAGALGGGSAMPAQAQASDTVTVLYRKDVANAPDRLDPAAQAAAMALEEEFIKQRFRVVRPSAEAYAILDQGPDVVVTFDPDAGFSMLFSVVRDIRPMQSADTSFAEVRIQARVYIGSTVLAAGAEAEGMGRMVVTVAGSSSERRGLELAARKAAAEMVPRVVRRLKELSPAELLARARPIPTVLASGQVVPQPRPAAPAPAPAVPSNPNEPLPAPARKFALVVGLSDFSRVNARVRDRFTMGNLPGVAVDVRNFSAALKGAGFPPDNVQVLAESQATSAAVRGHLMRLAATTQPNDLVVVMFSSHGAPADLTLSGYGMPVLDDFDGLKDTNAIDFWQIQGLIGHLPARQTVLIVDTCHAGGAANRMPRLAFKAGQAPLVSNGPVAPEPARLAADAPDLSRHYAILASSVPEQLSLEDPPHGGLFTSRLLRGLEASRGALPLAQVFKDHVEQQVVDHSKPLCKRSGNCVEQTPVFAYSGRGHMIRL